jgi:hypothetical protein
MTPDQLRELLATTAAQLAAGGARTEALARLGRRRGLLGIGGGLTFESVGRVWRLGVLLLAADAGLYSVGSVTRAAEERQHGYTAVSASERAAVRALAARSYPIGEVVNYEATPLELGSGAAEPTRPLVLVDGEVLIEWSTGQHPVALAPYLAERVALLLADPRP